MSPEQAGGRHTIVDHRTDIYSLGATLYELLTLRPLIDGQDRQAVLREIATAPPKPPRRIDRSIPVDLETIVLKAIEKHPADRYATAGQLADDLRRFVEHKTVQARRSSLLYGLVKWSRRHRTAVIGTTALLLTALLTSTVICAYAWSVAAGERKRADHEREIAVDQRAQAQANLKLAIDAVNDMYAGVATQWLASDAALSSIQHHFLQRALEIFALAAEGPQETEVERHTVATARRNMAAIHWQLDDYPQVRQALEAAIPLYERLHAASADPQTYGLDLIDCYTNLASVLDPLGLPQQALQTLDQSDALATRLAQRYPDALDYAASVGRQPTEPCGHPRVTRPDGGSRAGCTLGPRSSD